MKQRIMYKEVVSSVRVDNLLHETLRNHSNWNHEIVGYSRTDDYRRGPRSSVLIKFWKEVAK